MTASETAVTTAPGQPADPWTHAVAGIAEHDPVELLGVAAGNRVLVVVPHPDDESLALSGILRRLAAAGVALRLVVVTDGEAAYGGDLEAGAALGRTRRSELVAAVAALGIRPAFSWLGHPDGRVADHEAAVATALSRCIDGDRVGSRLVVLAPWVHDPHPDHQAAGRAAGVAARRAGVDLWWYPVWLRHVHAPDDEAVPWAQLRRFRLSDEDRAAKAVAIACHRSQLVGPDGHGPVLPATVLEHFEDGHELLITPAPGPADAAWHFDEMYAGSADPWAVGSSWYEARKRAVLLAALPNQRYRLAWEPGCSLGDLTVELATRCARVVASDVSARAVTQTRQRTADLGNVEVAVARLPDEAPPIALGAADLVVLSEVLVLPRRVRAAAHA